MFVETTVIRINKGEGRFLNHSVFVVLLPDFSTLSFYFASRKGLKLWWFGNILVRDRQNFHYVCAQMAVFLLPSFSIASTSDIRIEILALSQHLRQLLAVFLLCICRNGYLRTSGQKSNITAQFGDPVCIKKNWIFYWLKNFFLCFWLLFDAKAQKWRYLYFWSEIR